MSEETTKELKQNIKKFIELHGWDAFEEILQTELGLKLVSSEGGKRVYVHHTGEMKATIREIEVHTS